MTFWSGKSSASVFHMRMPEAPVNKTAPSGGGCFLSAASKARISFSQRSLGDLAGVFASLLAARQPESYGDKNDTCRQANCRFSRTNSLIDAISCECLLLTWSMMSTTNDRHALSVIAVGQAFEPDTRVKLSSLTSSSFTLSS